MLENTLSTNSSNETIFNESVGIYNDALGRAGYTQKLKYKPPEEMKRKRNRKGRKVIWFNPPWNASVATDVGRVFLAMIDRHFPKGTELHKIFNRNTVKVSYRTGKSMKQHIDAHNKAILRGMTPTSVKKCNSRGVCKDQCQVDGRCETEGVIYGCHANTSDTNGNFVEEKEYLGQTKRRVKERISEHITSISEPTKPLYRDGELVSREERIKEKKDKSELANYVWEQREKGLVVKLTWSIKRRAICYHNGQRDCDLCATEATLIAKGDPALILNKRNELFGKCREKNNFKLSHKKFQPP